MSAISVPATKSKLKRQNTCEKCQKSSVQAFQHCFHCGSDEHFARGCKKATRKPKSQSGNMERLQTGDRERPETIFSSPDVINVGI